MRFPSHPRAAGLAATAASVLAIMAAVPALAATLSRIRQQLRSWHLTPAPLYPRFLPSSMTGASISLSREGFDYNVDFARGNGGRTGDFLISLRRGAAGVLRSELRDPRIEHRRTLHLRGHLVYAFELGGIGKYVLAWHERGRSYLLIDKYQAPRTARATLTSLAGTLAVVG
jgi:hypothetical protein